jgi:hypothetical protein
MEKNVDNRAGGLRGKAVKIHGQILTRPCRRHDRVFHTGCGRMPDKRVDNRRIALHGGLVKRLGEEMTRA